TCKMNENSISQLEKEIEEYLDNTINEALYYKRPSPSTHLGSAYAPSKKVQNLPSFTLEKARNINAVNAALDYILANFPEAVIVGQDIGVYGSAFKTCKGLYEKYGHKRVMDMPISESATVGLCIGASQTGLLPIMEFQFADFSTEAATQLGLNAGSWYFRSGSPAQILFRLPCGAGISLGAFHSGEFEGIWSRFPGLKIFYPVTPQETFEALIAGFIDPNPCIVFEHKLLYGNSRVENINFNGDYNSIVRPRKYCEGSEITIVAFGAMVESVLSVVKNNSISADVWNPFILKPLMIDEIIESVKKTGKLLVVQESNENAGLGDRIISLICRNAFGFLKAAPRLLAAPDIPVPFAKELELYYIPDSNKIKTEIESLRGE
ncbi:MAG: hypothetical protein N2053_09340, partial [Chitinispirillaceae bacterium]|nr:hypothetical protein [Chitinispirillaceae bacterium]